MFLYKVGSVFVFHKIVTVATNRTYCAAMKTLILCVLFRLIHCQIRKCVPMFPSQLLSGRALAPSFMTCNRKEPNFKKCYLEAAQHGIQQLTRPYKSLNLPNMEPLDVPLLTVKGSGGAVAVDQNFKDCKLFGLTTTKFDRFELDFEKNTLDQQGIAPEITFKCHYNVTGKVLLLPVEGVGNSTVILKDFYTKIHFQHDRITRGNKTYYRVVNTDLDFTVSHVYFQFDNLFNGNKQLGDNINQVINDNWETIFQEIRPEYAEIMKQILQGMVQRVWSKVSLEEYFDN